MNTTSSVNATQPGMNDLDEWEQFEACFQSCTEVTELQQQLIKAGVRLEANCYLSDAFLNAPIKIKLKAQKRCLESLQAEQRSWQARQSSQQGPLTILPPTVYFSNSGSYNPVSFSISNASHPGLLWPNHACQPVYPPHHVPASYSSYTQSQSHATHCTQSGQTAPDLCYHSKTF